MSHKTLPSHLGIIMDGNRRWAKARSKDVFSGHEEGAEVLKEIALYGFKKGIKYISAYVFSKENWARTQKEIGFLMKLIVDMPQKYLDDFDKNGIRIVFLGNREGLRPEVLNIIEKSEQKTKNNRKAVLALCFNYGGHEEIVEAAKALIGTGIKASDVNEEMLAKHLYNPELPPIDLIIRTSGEQRISGFMLWRAAYSELYFTDKYWPAFTKKDLDKSLAEYASRQRRFGK